MALMMSRVQMAIKQEAVAGTAETLAAANVIPTTELATWESDIEITERNALTASFSNRGHVIGARLARIGFKMHYQGTTGAPTDPSNLPAITVPMRGCGVQATVSGAGPNEQTEFRFNTAFTTDETTGPYCTLGVYRDGKRYLIHGAVGNCVVTLRRGGPPMFDFQFTGIYNTPTDLALLVPSYPAVVPPPFLGASLSILGFTTAKLNELTLDFGNVISVRPYPNSLTGAFTAQIVGRRPSGSFDPEEELAGTKDWHNEFLAGTTGALNTGTFPSNGTNYNQASLSLPKIQYAGVRHEDRDSIATSPVDYVALANSDAGDDEMSFIQT